MVTKFFWLPFLSVWVALGLSVDMCCSGLKEICRNGPKTSAAPFIYTQFLSFVAFSKALHWQLCIRALATPKDWVPEVHVSYDVLTVYISEQGDGDLSPEFRNVAWLFVWGFLRWWWFGVCVWGCVGLAPGNELQENVVWTGGDKYCHGELYFTFY